MCWNKIQTCSTVYFPTILYSIRGLVHILSTHEYLSEFCRVALFVKILALFTLLQPTSNGSGDKSVYSEANVLRILRTFTTHRCGIVDGCDDAIIITRGADRQLGDYTICWYITMGVFDISDLLLIRLSYSYSHQLQHRLENVRHKQNVRTS